LCAECILFWRRTLSTANQPSVHALLAKKHHILRVRRFAEGFFVIDNPRHLATGSIDSNYHNYGMICEMARRSKYLSSLPPLPVHCVPLGKLRIMNDFSVFPFFVVCFMEIKYVAVHSLCFCEILMQFWVGALRYRQTF